MCIVRCRAASVARSRSSSIGEEAEVQLGEDVVADAPADVAPAASASPERTTISIIGSSKRAETGHHADREQALPASKRPRLAPMDAGRQRRLFGVLTKTLTQFKEDTKKETEASKRRAAVEERLASKMREETQALEARTSKEKAKRNLKYDLLKKEDERNALIAIVR